MTRVRIDQNGIAIAKPGFDVDSAPLAKMNFSPLFVSMQLIMKGKVTVADYSGYMADTYKRAIVTYPQVFTKPPLVLAAGQRSDGGVDLTNIVITVASNQNGFAQHLPAYQLVMMVNGFELYVNKVADYNTAPGTRPSDWRYWVFRNTLED